MKRRVISLILALSYVFTPVYAEKEKKNISDKIISVNDMFSSVSSDLYFPLFYRKSDIVIDGDLSEWSDESFIIMPADSAQIDYAAYGGKNDVSATVQFCYDEKNLYIAALVNDDKIIFRNGADAYWRGDSFQVAFGIDHTFGPEYGFGFDTNNAPTVFGSYNVAEKFNESVECCEVSDKETICYEIRIPWEATPFGAPVEEMQTCVLVNDNDSGNRDGWIEWKAGIGRNKNPLGFAKMLPLSKDQTIFAWLTGNNNVEHATEEKYRYYAANFGSEPKTVSVFVENDKKEVTIPAKSVYVKDFTTVFTTPGEYELEYGIGDEKKIFHVNVVKAAVPEELYARADALEKRMSAWRNKIDSLYQKGIAKDYMDVDYYVIEKFIPYVREDVARSVSEKNKRLAQRAMTQLDRMEEIAEGLDNKIAGFEKGTEKSLPVPLYRTSKIEKEGYHYIADTENSVTGERERRPVFFVGFGHLNQMRSEYGEFSKFGLNVLQGQVSITARDKVFFENWSAGGFNARASYGPSLENPASGEVSFMLTNYTEHASNCYASFAQDVPCKPNTNYTYSFKVRGENLNRQPQMVMNSSWSKRKYFGVTGNFDWKEVTYNYTTEANQISLPNRIIIDDVGTVFVDDALLYRTDDPEKTNLFKNSGFEEYTVSDGIYSLPSDEKLKKSVSSTMQNYLDNNLAVSVLYNSHYNSIISSLRPETKLDAVLGFQQIDIYDDLAREIEYVGAGQNAKALKGLDGVMDMMTANEPQYSTRINARHLPQFQEYLRNKYDRNIEKLNTIYRSKYNTFSDIQFPTENSGTPLFNDWMVFNDEMYSEWHSDIANEIHKNNDDIWVNAKVMGDEVTNGIDVERFAEEWYDINGCDKNNYYTVGSRTSGILKKLSYYDFMTSFLEAPISNAEDHILKDREQNYDERFAAHTDTDIWQGAIHSRGSSIMWVWQRATSDTDDAAESILYRPDCLQKVCYDALDLARLSKEVAAFAEEKSEVAILHSRTSKAFDADKFNSVTVAAYEALTYTGNRVSYLSDNQLIRGEWKDKKLLVIPNAIHIKDDLLCALRKFIEGG